jgi:hypothetical protein
MRLNILNRKSLLLVAVVVSLVAVTLGIISRSGQAVAQPGFSNASLQGTYAFVTDGGSPTEATFGLLVVDGNGNITSGNLTLNVPRSVLVPGATGRTTVPAVVTSGSYTINANGTGSTSAMASIPGQVLTRNYDLLVTEADGSTALELQAIQIEPTLGGGLGYFALKKIR